MATSQTHLRMTGARHQTGLTIIELMAVVSIVSILAVISIAVYQDYIVRAKVAEGLAFASEAKTTVTEYYYSNGALPTSNGQAGLPLPDDYNVHPHISRLEIRSTDPRPGSIAITFKIPNLGSDNVLHLIPSTATRLLSWTCLPADTNGIEISRVPPNCRG